MTRFRVAWQSKATGFQGFGFPASYQVAFAWVAYENERFPELHHWVSVENGWPA